MSLPVPPSLGKNVSSAPTRRHWRRFLPGLCLAQFVLLAVLVLLWRQPPPAPPAGGPLKPESSAQREPYFAGQPGPWGELEYARINIELTDEFALAEENNFPQTRWFFAGQTRETALGLCASSGLSAAQCETLASPALWTAAPDGVVLAPPGELVLNLSPEVRARLYAELAHNPQNNLHAWPFVYRSGGFAEWFGNSGLSAQSLGLIQQVIYHRGTALCVSDLPELCARIPDRAERLRLIKTLSRTASLLMKVRLRPDTDVAALTAYWGRGWHMKDIEPLLASLTKVPGGITLDVAHLLPPFARKRLNSYPTPLEPGQRAPDCYWTAWNFFRDPPDDRYFDDTIWRQELQENCQLVELPTFGDLVFLTRPDGVPIHCAVFIADDVVFTKNGANLRQPWKLMKMEDLLARYPEDFPLRVAVFRPKYPNR